MADRCERESLRLMTTPDFDREEAPVNPEYPTAAVPAAPSIQRGARTRFLPRTEETDDQVTVTRRALLGERRNAGKPTLSRHHKIAGNLPAWNPLPPNEQLIHRPR